MLMTSLTAYAQFLTARWDEIEQAARDVVAEEFSYDVTANCEVWADADRLSVGVGWMVADLAAKREVLGMARQGMSEYSTWAFERILHALAEPFRDHPDHPANQEDK